MIAHPGYDGVTPFIDDESEHRREIAEATNTITAGRLNVVLTDITLTDSATTTTITDARLHPFAIVHLMPLHADAATALPNVWYSDRNNGSIVINHASDVSTDQDFDMLIIG